MKLGSVLFMIILSCLLVNSSVDAIADPVAPAEQRKISRIFLPLTSTSSSSTTDRRTTESCAQLSPEAYDLLTRMRTTSNQRRASLNCDPMLIAAAQAHAEDMALRNFVAHVNPDGIGANVRAKVQGYKLPSYYSQDRDANNIESLAAGFTNGADVWQGFLASDSHRIHLLAETPFYQEQTNVGVGFYSLPKSRFEEYWVVVTAPPPTKSTKSYTNLNAPAVSFIDLSPGIAQPR